jgi:1-acyl-sn-glycerol-3-phosphate acyltransferase
MIVFLPFIFFYRVIYTANSYFARSVGWLLKLIVGIDYRIEGLKNLPIKNLRNENSTLNSQLSQPTKGFVIASKHQSAWETFIAFAFLPKVVFVYKVVL